MILDSQLVTEMTTGALRRSVGAEDSVLQIPPGVLITAPATRRAQPSPSTTIPLTESFINYNEHTRTNQAGQSQTLGILAPGAWELELMLASWFNFVNVAGAFAYTNLNLLFPVPVIGITLLAHYAAIGVQTTTIRLRFVLQDNVTLRLSSPTTGVGQSLDVTGFVNAIRLI